MPRLYFVRHAESEANSKNLLGGQLDYPLTGKGFRDATSIAAQFSRQAKIDRVYSSPLIRARQTAEVFADAFGIPEVHQSARIIEQNIGKYSGMSYEELKSDKTYEHDRTKRWSWIPDGGESYEMIADRVRLFFLEIIDPLPAKIRTLVVTHAVTLRLVRALLEKTIPAYPQEIAKNGEIWEVDYKGLNFGHHINSITLDSVTDHRE